MLKQAPIFSGLSGRDLGRFARAARVRTYKAGSVIAKEGERAVACFVISAGRVEVVKGADTGNPSLLATLIPS